MKRLLIIILFFSLTLFLASCETIKELFRKDEPPFFHDYTIELGEKVVLSTELFRTENARKDEKISAITDLGTLNIYVTGHNEIQLAYGDYIETVVLTVSGSA